MPRKHIVDTSDNVVALAEDAGFLDYRHVWHHADNAALPALGREPTVLALGDEITVPDMRERSTSLATGKNHTFILKKTPLRLRVKLCGVLNGDPLVDAPCEFKVEGAVVTSTNAEGMLDQSVRATTRVAELECAGFAPHLEVCALEPVETDRGLVARLNNLGYYAGEVEDDLDPERLRLAIEEFQLDQKVRRTGLCDPALRAMLKTEHGC